MRVVPVSELTDEHIKIWHKIIDEEPYFKNPFFSPEYCRLVGQCGQDVRVAIIENSGKTVGFFPFEMENVTEARPVGSIFCDYQGVVTFADAKWSPEVWLETTGISSYRFDHMLAVHHEFDSYAHKKDVSWLVDISRGFNAYEEMMREQKRGILKEAERKRKKLEQDIGNVTFTAHCVDHGLLDLLLEWKSDQWEKSGWPNRFKPEWEQKLMHTLLETDTEYFKGIFSVLKAGERPVAMHIGMRSKAVWHMWTTAYDHGLKKYSPGIIKEVEIIKAAEELGIQTIDYGKEAFEYKQRLHTDNIKVMEGEICQSQLMNV